LQRRAHGLTTLKAEFHSVLGAEIPKIVRMLVYSYEPVQKWSMDAIRRFAVQGEGREFRKEQC
jgi:hypothetical protein